MGSSPSGFHESIHERQHIRLQRGTVAAKDASTLLRMTFHAITIGETSRSGVGEDCHPEEAWVNVREVHRLYLTPDDHFVPTPRPTKDLLQHWIIRARFGRVDT